VAVVTRNAAETLAATLESVLAQDYPCLEIVVLDGASEDSTLDIVRRYEDRLDYWRSEKDGGPYEAMNAAAAVAAGRYVIFMNAGDRFQTADALSLALDGAPQDADVIVGHHVYRDVGGYDGLRLSASFSETCSRLRHGDVDWRWLSRVPCHQATLTLTELLRRNPYRADLRIAADHELLYRVAKQGARFHHSLAVIATYVGGGLSSRNQKRCFEEWRQVALEYSEEPEAVRRRFHVMRAEMRRSELPRLTLGQLLLCLAVRVPGSTRELKRRIRTRLAAESARRSERPVHVDFGAAKLRNESPGIEKLSRAELSKLEMPREHAQFAD
jgi:glycosyltransferase involved in cell wall biosynthesis